MSKKGNFFVFYVAMEMTKTLASMYYSWSTNCPLNRYVVIKGYKISIFNYVYKYIPTTSLVIIF